jgi:hypothetical protein
MGQDPGRVHSVSVDQDANFGQVSFEGEEFMRFVDNMHFATITNPNCYNFGTKFVKKNWLFGDKFS